MRQEMKLSTSQQNEFLTWETYAQTPFRKKIFAFRQTFLKKYLKKMSDKMRKRQFRLYFRSKKYSLH